jgi:GT2 family glycosyltransferase
LNTSVAIIVIGRNEGARLIACLDALRHAEAYIVYVDSGSTDTSVENAKTRGAQVVALDMSIPFTAARARNAGLSQVSDLSEVQFVQFIDGDCIIDPYWIKKARGFLENNPDVAVVSGRLRERFPLATVYNRMCDAEWDTPMGQVKHCGGIAMMRKRALDMVQGFNPSLIAGEEPELCVRLRAAGWNIWRIDAEMALHDAAMSRFSQFWKRSRRSGYAFAEGAALHGVPPERHWVVETRRALFWGLLLPVMLVLISILFWPWGAFGSLIYPVQIARLALREGGNMFAWQKSALLVLGKFAEAHGVLEYLTNRRRGHKRQLIEYK